ncbi:carbohydrate esterase family 4 protein, partial [Backusella circina FSU 941]
MVLKATLITAAALMGVQAAKTNYTSITNPLNITLPDIPQLTSLDPTQECVYYQSEYMIRQDEWPTVWQMATSNGMNTSSEFLALKNSIDWSKAPNISVRTVTPAGTLDQSTYNSGADPDCWWTSSTCKIPKIPDVNADVYACAEPDVWGLTFDDGPNCSHNAFYDYLLENKQKATMFYIGSNVLDWPYGALRGVKDGHHIASHTWSHKLMTSLTNDEVLAELYYAQKAVKFVTGLTPKYWRPAQGDLDDRVRWIATQINLTAVIWNLDTFDWAADVLPGVTQQTVEDNYHNYINMGTNGSFATSGNIVLSHEINNNTMTHFMNNYPAIKKAYSHVMDVATCMNITNPYIEDTVTFPTFAEAVANAT